jgi:hypothetical protein
MDPSSAVGAFGGLSSKERDEDHRDATDDDRDSPPNRDSRLEALGVLSKQFTDKASSLRHLRDGIGVSVTNCGAQFTHISVGIPS